MKSSYKHTIFIPHKVVHIPVFSAIKENKRSDYIADTEKVNEIIENSAQLKAIIQRLLSGFLQDFQSRR